MKAKKVVIWLVIVISVLSQVNFPVFAENELVTSQKYDALITVNVKNADIRDILSALAIKMGCNIIYMDEPVRLDFSVQNVTCEEALQILLKSAAKEYIKDNNTIIAGSRELLEKNYFDRIALTRFNIRYIRAEDLASLIDALSIPVSKVTLTANDKVILVQGFPCDLSKVAQLISLVDRPENAYSGEIFSLYSVSLTHITAKQLNEVLNELGIHGGFIIEANPMTLWIYGTKEDMALVNEIKTKLDIPQNAASGASTNAFVLKKQELQFLTSEKAEKILAELNINVNILYLDRKIQTVWLNGTVEEVDLAISVLGQLDVQENMEHDFITVFSLKNITAKEAMARLSHIEKENNIRFYTFVFPQFTKNVMVFCPRDYRLFALNMLEEIDVVTEEIKVPVDYSSVAGGVAKLRNRRKLICDITGIPEEKFTISENVARDDGYLFIMYLEASPDIIQYVKDVIKMIDNPLADGADY